MPLEFMLLEFMPLQISTGLRTLRASEYASDAFLSRTQRAALISSAGLSGARERQPSWMWVEGRVRGEGSRPLAPLKSRRTAGLACQYRAGIPQGMRRSS
jgi:hypothetical protein